MSELFKAFYKSNSGLCDRLVQHKLLRSEINKIILEKWKICTNNSKFSNELESIIKIDSGSFGDIYKARLKGVDFIIKEVYIAPYMLRKLGLVAGKEWLENQYPAETAINLMTNNILESGESQNFIYILGSYFCKPCRVRSICYNLLMENVNGNLVDINQLTQVVINGAVAQLLLGLNVLHKKYGIIHKNLNSKNILIKHVNAKGSFKYELNDYVFYIPNHGYIFMIANFNISSSIKPCYAFDAFLGTRNFKVEPIDKIQGWGEQAGCGYQLKPFNVKLKPIFSLYRYTVKQIVINPYINKWINKDNESLGEYTENIMSMDDLKPDLKLDLNNVLIFPALEFAGDIQDILRIFAGGYQYFQPCFIHSGFKETAQNIRNVVTYRNCTNLCTTDGKVLKYVFADIMTAFLFPNFKTESSIVVDDFKFLIN